MSLPAPSLKSSASTDSLSGINFSDPKWDALRDKDIDLGDYYTLLGLEDRSYDATEDEIRKAYRVLSLVCHPDKAKPSRREIAEERFKAMQVGFETLTDPVRRRAYDSTLDFDDAIPKSHHNPSLTSKTLRCCCPGPHLAPVPLCVLLPLRVCVGRLRV